MDILGIAEENLLVSLGVVLGIGVIQGSILGRGIRHRFPGLKVHARAASVILLVLFSVNAVFGTLKFANPDKISLSDIAVPQNITQGIDLLITVLGLNAGFGAVLALFVSVSLVLMFWQVDLPNIGRYFVFVLGVIMLLVAVLGRFTEYIPAFFEIMIYAGYQVGITAGIFVVTARRGDTEL